MNENKDLLEQNGEALSSENMEQEHISKECEAVDSSLANEAAEGADMIADPTVSEQTEEITFDPPFDEKKEKRTFSIIGFGLAAFSLVTILVSSILMVAVSIVSPDIAQSALFMHALTPVSLYLFALPILMIFLSKVPAKAPEKKKLKFTSWLLFLVVGFGLMYIGAQVSSIVMGLVSSILGYDPMNSIDNMVMNSNIWVNFIFLVIVAPIGEEFVFRKLIIDRTQKYGCFISAMFSGVVFGLMHGNLYQCFYAFALGLLLGYLYYNTGKLLPVIGIHAVINFVSGVLAGILSDNMVAFEDAWNSMEVMDMQTMLTLVSEHWLTIVAMLLFLVVQWGAMACAIVLPIVLRKRIVLEKGEIEIPRGRKFATAFLSAGAIVMFVFYFMEIGLSLLPT